MGCRNKKGIRSLSVALLPFLCIFFKSMSIERLGITGLLDAWYVKSAVSKRDSADRQVGNDCINQYSQESQYICSGSLCFLHQIVSKKGDLPISYKDLSCFSLLEKKTNHNQQSI